MSIRKALIVFKKLKAKANVKRTHLTTGIGIEPEFVDYEFDWDNRKFFSSEDYQPE